MAVVMPHLRKFDIEDFHALAIGADRI
jgi:hypothetical protein